MNVIWGLNGFVWSEIVADLLNAINAFIILWCVNKKIIESES